MADRIIQLTDKNGDKVYPIGVAGLPPAMDLVNIFYPVGSIYTSIDSTFDPNTAWGGTWEKIAAGKFLEATETAADVGTNAAAGLPNIEGAFSSGISSGAVSAMLTVLGDGATGAFKAHNNYTGQARYGTENFTIQGGDVTGNNWATGATFDASRSNSIYGSSTTVHPESIKVFIWKRTA